MLVGWWDNTPSANIGIACGKRSGIVVLDVDKDHGGYDSLTELVLKYSFSNIREILSRFEMLSEI